MVFMLDVVRNIGESMTCNFVKPSLEARVQRLGKISARAAFFKLGCYPIVGMKSIYRVVLWTELCLPPPQHSYVEALMLSVMVFEDGTFGI